MQGTPDVNVNDGDALLRRSQRTHRPTISSDYVIYLQEHEVWDLVDLPTRKPSLVLKPLVDAMKDEMSSMLQNEV